MAYTFGDGFDCYATTADAVAGYWDSGDLTGVALVTGRFASSRCLSINSSARVHLAKASGVNDAVHHVICAFQQTAALSGTIIAEYFQLLDGATGQVCICFRSDGAILFTSGTPGGTVLATYTGAISAQNTWFAFEFEVVIHPTAGRFRARKNGNTVDDFDSGATLNTRPGTNSYANKLQVASNSAGVNAQLIDDILWRSDASSVPFVGDVRCYTRMPASDASAQFARSPSPVVVAQSAAASGTSSKAANAGMMSAFTALYTGTIASGAVQVSVGGTGNMKAAIYDATRAIVLATSNAVVNPTTGANAITFGTPLTVTKGTTYYLATDQDFSITYSVTGANQYLFTTPYASFPAANPALSTPVTGPVYTLNITPTVNADFVNETLQDGTASYVYDSTVGHADFYTLAPLAVTPASVVATITRGFVCKSDAGTRTGAVQLKSGGAFNSTTWNPSDQVNTTLSGGNLVATFPGAGGVRSVVSVTTGKWYWETTWTSGPQPGAGVANASAALGTAWATPTNAAIAYNGSIYVNNANVSAGPTLSGAGTIICIALDIDAKLIWFRVGPAGAWNAGGSANPATGVGGVSVSVLGTPLFALVATASSSVWTANFGASTFSGAVPSGFTAGLGGLGTIVATPAPALSTSFGWLWRADTTDPATGSAWTPAAVNAATIGPVVSS